MSGQVGAGTLSQGQADTLKSFFENLASPPKDVRSDRGPDGAKGPPPRREDKVDAKGSTDARLPVDPAGDPAASAVSQAIADALAAFLKNLQASNSATKGYGTFANTMPTTPSVVMDKTI